MCFCNCDQCKNIKWGGVFWGAIVFTIIGLIVSNATAYLTMSYYKAPAYFEVWSKVMMPEAGPPPMSFFAISIFFSFLTGLILSYLYAFIKELLPKSYWQKVNCFASIVIGLSFVLFTLTVYLLFNVPLGLLAAWFLSSIVAYYLSSMAIVKIVK
jgi:hypothetical protein